MFILIAPVPHHVNMPRIALSRKRKLLNLEIAQKYVR